MTCPKVKIPLKSFLCHFVNFPLALYLLLSQSLPKSESLVGEGHGWEARSQAYSSAGACVSHPPGHLLQLTWSLVFPNDHWLQGLYNGVWHLIIS